MLTTAANHTVHTRPAAPIRANTLCEGPLGLMGAPMRFARNTEIYGEDEAAARSALFICPATFSGSKQAKSICRRQKRSATLRFWSSGAVR
jgi:hypothetical protein